MLNIKPFFATLRPNKSEPKCGFHPVQPFEEGTPHPPERKQNLFESNPQLLFYHQISPFQKSFRSLDPPTHHN